MLADGDEPPEPGRPREELRPRPDALRELDAGPEGHAHRQRAVPLDHGHEKSRPTAARQPHNNRGFGDTSFYSRPCSGATSSTSPTTWLELRGMVKAPTGQSDEDDRRRAGPAHPGRHRLVGLRPGPGGGPPLRALRAVREHASTGSTPRARSTTSTATCSSPTWSRRARRCPLVRRAAGCGPGAELNFRYAGHDQFDDNLYDSSGGSIVLRDSVPRGAVRSDASTSACRGCGSPCACRSATAACSATSTRASSTRPGSASRSSVSARRSRTAAPRSAPSIFARCVVAEPAHRALDRLRRSAARCLRGAGSRSPT